jgi:hypothetical protein
MLNGLKEAALLVGLMAELVAKNPKGSGGVAEGAGNLKGRPALDEVSAEGFVLSVEWVLGSEEELGSRR